MSASLKVLFVDDNDAIHDTVEKDLGEMGHEYEGVFSGEEATGFSKEILSTFDVAVVDWDMPGMNGFETAQYLKCLNPSLFFIMLTGHGTPENITDSFKNNFVGFLTKPVSFETFKEAFNHPLIKQCQRHKQIVQEEAFAIDSKSCMVGNSKLSQDLKKLIQVAAETETTILIGGESGTGKEYVAKALHHHSSRKNKPFQAFNCAAITPSLAESELFGFVKGAFTGAQKDTPGKIMAADGGTLFLDEIGDMSLEIQSKLLRVIEEREVTPVGTAESEPVDVRIIAATHQNLEEKVASKEFRQDLFFRLNVVPLSVPPLRDRPEDVLDLVSYLYEKARLKGPKNKFTQPEISSKTKELLLQCDWPGNIRQLRNVVERAFVFGWDSPLVTAELTRGQEAVVQESDLQGNNQSQQSSTSCQSSDVLDKEKIEKCKKRLQKWELAAMSVPDIELRRTFKPEALGNAIQELKLNVGEEKIGATTQSIGQFVDEHIVEFFYLLKENKDMWPNIRKLEKIVNLMTFAEKVRSIP